ncbi:TRAP transporter large permease [Aquibacillus sediminis]|uniref:TRAP transporter large permease n=1 Tax=Aquibacillus sediminis TaxID=2574734 RepID=UPI0011088784|nr:TRAP transporter large permease [Aquibacillus sediminis]
MFFLLLLVVFFILLLLGLPVAFTLAILGAGILLFEMDPQMANLQVPQIMYNSLDDSLLVAIPAFILTGQIILHSGIGTKAFHAADKWLGHFPGGLAIATVVTCSFFAALTGSSIATVVTLGFVASTEMIRHGYPKELAYGVIAASGTLGILIPPSGPMILYGALTEQSVSSLFMAGLIPGLLLVGLFIIYIILVYSKKLPKQQPATWGERKASLREIIWLFSLPIIIIGGIYSGLFTVTEAASVSFVVSLFLGVVVYKTIKWKEFLDILKSSASNTGMIMLILSGALLFGFAITIIELPQMIQSYITSLNVNRWVVILIIFGIFTLLGMFMEVVSILLIMVPIIFPVVEALGFDLIWFGVFTVIALEMAIITPPVGMNLFVMMQISEKQKNAMNIIQMSKAAFPYLLLIILLILLICIFPSFVTWLPFLMDG